MKINIETKFESGQEVYYIFKRLIPIKCEICNGEGKININNSIVKECPYCNSGNSEKEKRFYVPRANKILNADIYRSMSNQDISYSLGTCKHAYTSGYRESDIFLNRQEAQRRCDELNKENGWTDEQIKELMKEKDN